jgi:hypothetical protein
MEIKALTSLLRLIAYGYSQKRNKLIKIYLRKELHGELRTVRA